MSASRVLIVWLALGAAPMSAWAASEADARASLASARAEQVKASAAKAAWTPTDTALIAAEKALGAHDFDLAKQQADEALALARRSLRQTEEQKSTWRDAVIR